MGDITGKTLVFYSELGEITGKSGVLPCGFALIYCNRYVMQHDILRVSGESNMSHPHQIATNVA